MVVDVFASVKVISDVKSRVGLDIEVGISIIGNVSILKLIKGIEVSDKDDIIAIEIDSFH